MRFIFHACALGLAWPMLSGHFDGDDGDAAPTTELIYKDLDGMAFCMDESVSGYFFKQSPVSGSSKLVIYMAGGGGCDDKEGCEKWANSTYGPGTALENTRKGSSKDWPTSLTVAGQSTIFLSENQTDNPGFWDAHHLFVPYCSGDAHMGTNEEVNDASWGFRFSGHNNFKAIVFSVKSDWESHIALQAGQSLEILLYGESTGGRGTVVNCDWLAEYWSDAEVSCSPWAGWYFPGNIDNTDFPDLPPTPLDPSGVMEPPTDDEYRESLIPVYNAMKHYIPRNCRLAHPEEKDWFKCIFAHNIYPHLSTRMFIVEDLFDYSKLASLNCKKDENSFTEEQTDYMAMYQEALKLSTVESLKDGDGVFLPSCYAHGSPNARLSYDSGTEVTRAMALLNWYENTDANHVLVDTCGTTDEGVPCGTGCR